MARWTRPLALTECHNLLNKKHPVLATYSIQTPHLLRKIVFVAWEGFSSVTERESKNTQKVTYEECNYSVRLNTTPLLQTTEEHYICLGVC
jgi:hypothetical protein